MVTPVKWIPPSRAYYSAYHFGRDFIVELGFTVTCGSAAHGEVKNFLGGSKVQEMVVASCLIGVLQSKRIDADYELEDTAIEERNAVQDLVGHAHEVHSLIDQHKNDPNLRSAVQQGIANYQDKMRS